MFKRLINCDLSIIFVYTDDLVIPKDEEDAGEHSKRVRSRSSVSTGY